MSNILDFIGSGSSDSLPATSDLSTRDFNINNYAIFPNGRIVSGSSGGYPWNKTHGTNSTSLTTVLEVNEKAVIQWLGLYCSTDNDFTGDLKLTINGIEEYYGTGIAARKSIPAVGLRPAIYMFIGTLACTQNNPCIMTSASIEYIVIDSLKIEIRSNTTSAWWYALTNYYTFT
jgi:hypothetical protein